MATLAERILEAIRYTALDDDVLAKRLGVGHRQAVNQAARALEAQGRLRRFSGADGKIVNALSESAVQEAVKTTPGSTVPGSVDVVRITEDEVKEAVRDLLALRGFDVTVAWGRVRGIDIDARHADGPAATSLRPRPRLARMGLSTSTTSSACWASWSNAWTTRMPPTGSPCRQTGSTAV